MLNPASSNSAKLYPSVGTSRLRRERSTGRGGRCALQRFPTVPAKSSQSRRFHIFAPMPRVRQSRSRYWMLASHFRSLEFRVNIAAPRDSFSGELLRIRVEQIVTPLSFESRLRKPRVSIKLLDRRTAARPSASRFHQRRGGRSRCYTFGTPIHFVARVRLI